MSALGQHSADTFDRGDGQHIGSCSQCGWMSRPRPTAEAARATAERHVKTATEGDRRAYMLVYGPRGRAEE